MGLYSVDEKTGVVRLGVDSTNVYGLDEGRPSIRLESKEAYKPWPVCGRLFAYASFRMWLVACL